MKQLRHMIRFDMKSVFAALLLIALAYMSVAGLSATMTDNDMTGMMCPFMEGSESMCSMGALGHITTWNTMSSFVLSEFDHLLLAASITISVLVGAYLRRSLFQWLMLSHRYIFRFLYYKKLIARQVTDLLTRLFANGILNPRYH